MFNIELHRVRFDANERSYFLQGLLSAKPEQKKRYPYRYHRRGHWGAVNTSEQVGKGEGRETAYLYYGRRHWGGVNRSGRVLGRVGVQPVCSTA